ncbi:hypothetical protein OIV83_005212 [Microbotryomycetes sp. JL201]|nr:hypothetical protein OIV83_005212 [Microbotryomycetes sp. JL201]
MVGHGGTDQSTLSMHVTTRLAAVARDTFEQHLVDVHEAHSWLERFFETLTVVNQVTQQPAAHKHAHTHDIKHNARHAMTELMKTPGKTRPMRSSANIHKLSTKDPVATLLFPSSSASAPSTLPKKQHSHVRPTSSNKENSPAPATSAARNASANAQPNKPSVSSGLSSSTTVRSPLRPPASAAASSKKHAVFKPTSSLSSIANLPTSPMLAPADFDAPAATSDDHGHDHEHDVDNLGMREHDEPAQTADLSKVLEEDEQDTDEGEPQTRSMDVDVDANQDVSHFSTASTVHQEEHLDLSIIGEEAEDDEQQAAANNKVVPAPEQPTSQGNNGTEAKITDRTEASSSQQATKSRVASTASSVAEEADADVAIPLNDAPSALRSNQNPLSSSVPASASNTHAIRTPGGNVSRFAIGTFSAARVGFGSSPPPPSTSGKSRSSTGGTRQLNFVGLPKKSIGLGLGLGRSWTSDSQSQGSQDSSSAAAPAHVVTTTGAVKRKSLSSQDENVAKTQKVDTQDATAAEEAAAKARRDALANRMKSMQARQSTAAGASRVSGIMGSSATLLPTASVAKPANQADVAAKAVTPLIPTQDEMSRHAAPMDAASLVQPPVATSVETAPAPTRRPSVMDRVRSLEKVAAVDAIPPSPSRIPSAFSRPTSPVPSNLAGLRSPSRRIPMSPSATAALSKIGSPAQKAASPAMASRMQFRSPVASPSRLPHSSLTARLQDAANANKSSSTPRMSPPSDLTRAKSIEQQLAPTPVRPRQDVQSQQDTIRIVSIHAEQSMDAVDDDAQPEDETRLASLPLPLDMTDHVDAALEADDEDEVVVEKGRGAFASAMEVDVTTLNGKIVMPGSFAAGIDDEVDMTELVETGNNNAGTLSKKTSQASLASTNSTVSQGGGGGGVLSSLFGKATKKTDNPKALKSIQMAAAAARKEQEEKERKAAAKEEREQKRLALLQKKQDEERVKVEEERRARAELAEKKRKEREEAAAERAKLFKPKSKDDVQRIKPSVPSKGSDIGKPQSMRPPVAHSAGYQSATMSSSLNRNPLSTSQGRPGTGPSSANNTPGNNLKSSSSSTAQARSMVGVKFMAHPGGPPSAPRAAAMSQSQKGVALQPMRQAPPPPQTAPEPEIELPEIDSEYSDSGDEAHEAKVKALPNWAQSPALAAALYRQQHVDPRDIFGPIQPLSMQEIFRSNHTRFTKRTSSAIWEGTDALTADDLARYNQAMGYQR